MLRTTVTISSGHAGQSVARTRVKGYPFAQLVTRYPQCKASHISIDAQSELKHVFTIYDLV